MTESRDQSKYNENNKLQKKEIKKKRKKGKKKKNPKAPNECNTIIQHIATLSCTSFIDS